MKVIELQWDIKPEGMKKTCKRGQFFAKDIGRGVAACGSTRKEAVDAVKKIVREQDEASYEKRSRARISENLKRDRATRDFRAHMNALPPAYTPATLAANQKASEKMFREKVLPKNPDAVMCGAVSDPGSVCYLAEHPSRQHHRDPEGGSWGYDRRDR